MIAAGNEHHVKSDECKPGAEGSTDCACAENDVASHVPHRNLAQW